MDFENSNSLLDHGSDVPAVLENQASGLPCFADGKHPPWRRAQVVGRNHLVREEAPETPDKSRAKQAGS